MGVGGHVFWIIDRRAVFIDANSGAIELVILGLVGLRIVGMLSQKWVPSRRSRYGVAKSTASSKSTKPKIAGALGPENSPNSLTKVRTAGPTIT